MAYYAVVRIADGDRVYVGDSESLAAKALEAGTCYGRGDSEFAAVATARDSAKDLRRTNRVAVT